MPDLDGEQSVYTTRWVRNGRTYAVPISVPTAVLAKIEQGRAALHEMAAGYAARGEYREALWTLPDYERLDALEGWTQQGVSPELLFSDPSIRFMVEDLVVAYEDEDDGSPEPGVPYLRLVINQDDDEGD